MPVKILSATLFGLDVLPVDVEVDSTPGLRFFHIVGLPDKVVEESKDRIASAIRNTGFIPYTAKNKRVIVNLAPADIKKEGPLFDLPIALGYLLATAQVEFNVKTRLSVGELSLDGSLRPVNGVLPIAIFAKNKGFDELIVPVGNVKEASLVRGLNAVGARNLGEVLRHLSGEKEIRPYIISQPGSEFQEKTSPAKVFQEKNLGNVSRETLPLNSVNILHENKDKIQRRGETPKESSDNNPAEQAPNQSTDADATEQAFDLSLIKGQENAKFAITVAAAGGHNMLMYGPPGAGKTLLAKAFSTILPKMTYDESLEVTKLFSVAGLLNGAYWIDRRPFRNPHHTASASAIIGGGTFPRPGEISLAHRGVLFLDELPEFPRDVLESLRQPLEDGEVTISRTAGTMRFPAKFILLAAMNPCSCGNFGGEDNKCICLPSAVSRYQKKISGPLLDRIDLHVNVPRETFQKIAFTDKIDVSRETSAQVREKVEKARKIQLSRFKTAKTNAQMGIKDIEKYCHLDKKGMDFIEMSVEKKNISARGYHKILKVSRTIADLDGRENISTNDIARAINFRFFDELPNFS